MWTSNEKNELGYELSYKRIKEILISSLDSVYYQKTLGLSKEKIKEGISYEEFARLPILTKEKYRENIFEIVNHKFEINKENYQNYREDYNAKKLYLWNKGLYVKVTSGSTGIPLEIIKSVNDINKDYFSLNLFRRKVLGKLPTGNFLWIWPANKFTQKYFYSEDTNFYKVNDHGYQFMIAEYSDERFEELVNFIREKNIQWVTASPSVLVYFSDYIMKNGLETYSFQYVECHSEFLYEWQSELIEKVFGVRPTNVYSSNEIQFMGCSCTKEHMHVIARNAFVELIPNEDNRNEVIVTSLNNMDVPLIRYKIGDCAEWGIEHECELKKYPCIELKKYRCNDYLIPANGKKYEPFVVCDAVVFVKAKFNFEINKYTVFQKKENLLVWFIDADSAFWKKKKEIVEFLKEYLKEITACDFEIILYKYEEVFKYVNTAKYKYFIYGVENE